MCSPPTAVIFDLDGTLVQTREASWQIFAPISDRYRLPVDTAEKFYELFAENFYASLREVCDSAEVGDAVTAEFMSALNSGYEPAMVPGLVDVVKAMVPYSKLAVLSSNTTAVVRRILRANHLEYCFAHVFGGDVEPDKTVGIARFLADAAGGSGRLCRAYYDEPVVPMSRPVTESTDPRDVVLVTDTVGDVDAAVRSGIRAVGVAWGMHTEEQLMAAGAEFVAIWPQELLAYLYGPTGDRCDCSSTTGECRTPSSVIDLQSELADRRRERRRATVVDGNAPGTTGESAIRRPDVSATPGPVAGAAATAVTPARVGTDRLLASALERTMR